VGLEQRTKKKHSKLRVKKVKEKNSNKNPKALSTAGLYMISEGGFQNSHQTKNMVVVDDKKVCIIYKLTSGTKRYWTFISFILPSSVFQHQVFLSSPFHHSSLGILK
jgi:hypothetical protein